MNTLKEAIQARKAESQSGHICYSTQWSAVTTLRIETSGAEVWIFPWHHFVCCRHQAEGERERLVLTFAANEIILSGTYLAALMELITEQRLATLCTAPRKYYAAAEEKEPFVEEIQIRSLAG